MRNPTQCSGDTAKNTAISPNFLVWRFCKKGTVSPEFRAIRESPTNFWYSLNQPWREERLNQSWNHLVLLSPRPQG